MNPDLIILTACTKPKNIIQIEKSIRQLNGINFVWMIGFDLINCESDISPTEYYLLKLNKPNYLWCSLHLPEGKHYGGEVYNPILNLVQARLNIKNSPWVYILDHDNIIHPLFPDYFRQLLGFSKVLPNHKIAWMTDRRGYGGYVDESDQYFQNVSFEYYGHQGYTPRSFCPDPSQVLLKLDFLLDVGMYGGGFEYDFKWFTPTLRAHSDKIIWFYKIDDYGADIVRCYWNGLRTEDEVLSDLFDLNHAEATGLDVIFESTNERNKTKVYPILKKSTKEAILKLIRADILEDSK